MCSTTMKLYYFDGKGRVEATRQMFAIAGEKFDDIRYSQEEWAKIKNTDKNVSPFGQLPALELCKGHVICQSHAIEYYVAKKFGFLGENSCDEIRILMVSHCIDDILKPVMSLFSLKGDEKEAARSKYEKEVLEGFLKKLTAIIIKNKEKSILVSGKKISLADLRILAMFQFQEAFNISYDKAKFPELTALKDLVLADSKLKAYLDKRPVTAF